jgi:hypothetical protein
VVRGGTAPVAPEHLQVAAAIAEQGLRADSEVGAAFSLLGAMLSAKGFTDPALRYFHAWDVVACPICAAEFVFCDHWWGGVGAGSSNR